MKSYKHDLYLIEPTKLLEGIMCQSLTFTNTLGKTYTNKQWLIPPTTYQRTYAGGLTAQTNLKDSDIKNILDNIYLSPVPVGSTLNVYTPYWLAGLILNTYKEEEGQSQTVWIDTATLTISNGGQTLNYDKSNTNKFIEIIASQTITYRYDIWYQGTSFELGDDGEPEGIPTNINDHLIFTYVASGVENRYPTKPWTITDCINRCLELAEPLYKGQNPRYRLQGVTYENGEIEPYSATQKYEPGSLAEKYDKIMAPEFTMTRCTLREQLKVIGGYIHAEPRLGYKRTEYGEILYDSDVIVFQPYAIGKQAEIADLPYIARGTSQSLNEYSTEVITNVQHIVNTLEYAKGVTIQPNTNNYNTLRTDNINVKLIESASKVKTNLPIYKPVKVMCGMYGSNGNWLIEPVDITQYVFEEHEYNNLSSYEGAYPYVKSYAIYYKQGSKDIEGLWFKPEIALDIEYLKHYTIVNILAQETGKTAYEIESAANGYVSTLAFQVTYTPVYNSVFSHGKQLVIPGKQNPFVTIYNQSENLIENRHYGEHIKGVAQRLGNIEETRTYKVGKKSMIPYVGEMIGEYFISAVTYDVTHNYYKVSVALTKDFNRISQYIGVNSTKRISEVSEKETYMRDILIKEKVCIGNNTNIPLQPAKVLNTLSPFGKLFGSTVPSYNKPITAVVASGRSKTGATDLNNTRIVLPVVASAFGNAMVFTWSYKDNYSAGDEVKPISEGYWQTDVPYCDYFGRLWWYDFQLRYNLENGNQAQALTCRLTAEDGVFSTAYSDIGTVGTGRCTSLRVRKDSRESLNFNYEVEVVTDRQDINIGSAIATLNPLVTEFDGRVPEVFFYSEEIGKFEGDWASLGTPMDRRTLTVAGDYTVSFELSYRAFKSWVIAYPRERNGTSQYSDEDGNIVTVDAYKGGEILISCNKSRAEYEAGANGNDQTPIQEELLIKAYSNY